MGQGVKSIMWLGLKRIQTDEQEQTWIKSLAQESRTSQLCVRASYTFQQAEGGNTLHFQFTERQSFSLVRVLITLLKVLLHFNVVTIKSTLSIDHVDSFS